MSELIEQLGWVIGPGLFCGVAVFIVLPLAFYWGII